MNRHVRDIARARDLVRQLASACELAQNYVRTHELDDENDDLADSLTHNLHRAHDVAVRLNAVRLGLSVELDSNFYSDLGRASALTYALGHDLGRARGRNHDRYYVLRRSLRAAAEQDVDTEVDGWTLGQVPQGLVALAVWVLPVRDQPRYREEFRVELGELSRSQRWGYALRTLCGAWELRRALTETVRTPDGTPARRVTEW